jgi:ankyrin repeat protein
MNHLELIEYAEKGNIPELELSLLSADENIVNKPLDVSNNTLIHYAALNQQIETVCYLISKGFDLFAKNIFQKSAADYLTTFNKEPVIRYWWKQDGR